MCSPLSSDAANSTTQSSRAKLVLTETLHRTPSGHAATAIAFALCLSGCYYHAMGGAAVATSSPAARGALVTVSSGINGPRGGFGLNGSGVLLEGQSSAMLGVEAFRLWRSESGAALQPYVRGALGVVELGSIDDELLFGSLSPRGELGLLWLNPQFRGISLSLGAEYRPRLSGPSTPLVWMQLGFGGFDYIGTTTQRKQQRPPQSAPQTPE